MGSRSNIVLKQQDGTSNLWLYSHWGGEEFITKGLAQALTVAKGRVGDEEYFNRIMITEMFKDLVGSETGGGVSLSMGDNNCDILVVDQASNKVTRHTGNGIEGTPETSWTIEEYIAEYS